MNQQSAAKGCYKTKETVSISLGGTDELFVPNMSRLYRAATRVLQNPQDSEDAVQDGLLSAFRHLDQFQGRSRLSTWLHTIVTNAAYLQLRKRSNWQMIPIAEDRVEEENNAYVGELLVDPRANPEEQCARTERSQMLRSRMRSLPPAYRSVVQLCVIEGLLLREIAEKLGVSVGTVKTRLRRAKKLLFTEL